MTDDERIEKKELFFKVFSTICLLADEPQDGYTERVVELITSEVARAVASREKDLAAFRKKSWGDIVQISVLQKQLSEANDKLQKSELSLIRANETGSQVLKEKMALEDRLKRAREILEMISTNPCMSPDGNAELAVKAKNIIDGKE